MTHMLLLELQTTVFPKDTYAKFKLWMFKFTRDKSSNE